MEAPEVVADALGRLKGLLERSLDGLTPEQLTIQPSPDSNPIGWLCWHLTRVQDDHVSNLTGREQAWVADGWHAKFNLPADATDYGTGDSIERVRAFRAPDAQTLLDYYNAIHGRTQEYLSTLTSEEMDKPVNDDRWTPPPSVGVRLVSVIGDNTQHAGQIAYLRGYISGLGWRT
ncbi:MAG: DinB family protein [Chloroflexi bacterium]|nr:DinB family protein [Chloroflexota bacterium]